MTKSKQRQHGTDTAYTHAEQQAPIDAEISGHLWRASENAATLAERYVAAREAASYGPGIAEAHILTRNRLSQDPANMRRDGTLADPEVVALARLRKQAASRLRDFNYWLEGELADLKTERQTEHRPDVRNAEVARDSHAATSA